MIERDRKNIELRDDGIYCCDGNHHRSQDCEYYLMTAKEVYDYCQDKIAAAKESEARISELESIARTVLKTVLNESKYCEAYDIGAVRYNSARQALLKAMDRTMKKDTV